MRVMARTVIVLLPEVPGSIYDGRERKQGGEDGLKQVHGANHSSARIALFLCKARERAINTAGLEKLPGRC